MKTILNKSPALLLSLLVLSITTACTKDRPERFSQGQGTDLQSIADYQNKVFELDTLEELAPANITKASKLIVSSDLKNQVNNFALVNYNKNTAPSLLGDLPFRGKPGTKYEIRYSITPNYLKILKVAKEEDIPTDERAYAETLSDGRLAVPLVGYRIRGFYRIDHAKNESNENSNILVEMPEPTMDRATHFKVDFLSRTIFQAEEKVDVYPASLFQGEWYHAATIISADPENENSVSQNINYDTIRQEATLVKFLPTDRSLQVVNLGIDSRLNSSDPMYLKPTLEIPAEWIEWRARKIGTDTDLSDERVYTNRPTNRPYVKIALNQATGPNSLGADSSLADVELAKDYFSFTLVNAAQGGRVKYSFSRATKRDYTPKQYFEDNTKIFGFFPIEKPFFKDFKKVRKEDLEKEVHTQRFNPKSKEIRYHFTRSSPNWVRQIGRNAVAAWNNAFKAAYEGSGQAAPEIILDEQDVELGDLRYNVINFIEGLYDGGLKGFGPSTADPRTGEVISAAANIQVTSMLSDSVEALRSYIAQQLGVYAENLGQAGKANVLLSENSADALLSVGSITAYEAGNKNSNAAIENAKALLNGISKNGIEASKKNAQALLDPIPFNLKALKDKKSFDCEHAAIVPLHTFNNIKEKCPEIDDYISDLKRQGVTHDAREEALLDSCSRKIVISYMYGALLHEMGHNFGLMHNFHASNDVANFYTAKETNTKNTIRASSVMDYPGAGDEFPSLPGKYDIAAIRFGYTDRIEITNDPIDTVEKIKKAQKQIVSVDPQKSITQNTAGKTLFPYKYCNDTDAYYGLDPMCNPEDAGVTPLEVVNNIIDQYYSIYAKHNFRYDHARSSSEERLINYKMAVVFNPLKRFYDQWRFHLGQFLGQGKEYLDELDVPTYQRKLREMQKPENKIYSELYKEYYPAAHTAFSFLSKLAMLPNKYCVVRAADEKDVRVIELEKVRDDIYNKNHISVNSCRDPDARAYFADSKANFAKKELSFVSELGYHLNSFRYNLDDKVMDQPLDVIGNRYDRLFAMITLVKRSSDTLLHENKGFYPNFLDEPDYRAELANLILPRLGAGVVLEDVNPKKPFLKFQYEKDLLSTFGMFYQMGTKVPNMQSVNELRNRPYEVLVSPLLQNVQGAPAVTRFSGLYFAAPDKKNTVAISFIQKHLQLFQIKNTPDLNPNIYAALTPFFDALPESKDAAKITLKQFMGLMNAYVQNAQKSPEEVQAHLIGLVSAEYQIYAGFIQQMQQLNEEQTKSAMDEPLSKFLNPQGPQYALFKDTIQERKKKYILDVKDTVAFYRENKADIDAQIDVIQNFIMSMARNSL